MSDRDEVAGYEFQSIGEAAPACFLPSCSYVRWRRLDHRDRARPRGEEFKA
ncbi:MAG TPA: hypothetical protein VM736_00450 [Gemmatimonadales bacterium]|nr:hypothetical protein [Gemmatimonadales bacterium]